MKREGKLPIGAIIFFPILALIWCISWYRSDRKPWSEFVSGMKKHKHNYKIPCIDRIGVHYQCDHYGCYFISQEKS